MLLTLVNERMMSYQSLTPDDYIIELAGDIYDQLIEEVKCNMNYNPVKGEKERFAGIEIQKKTGLPGFIHVRIKEKKEYKVKDQCFYELRVLKHIDNCNAESMKRKEREVNHEVMKSLTDLCDLPTDVKVEEICRFCESWSEDGYGRCQIIDRATFSDCSCDSYVFDQGKVEQIKTNTFKSENNLRKAECCMTCDRVTFTHCGDVVICDLRPDMDIEKSSVCNKYQHL